MALIMSIYSLLVACTFMLIQIIDLRERIEKLERLK